MKEFPTNFTPENSNSFENIVYNRNKCYLRRDIYEHVISHKEEEYFDIETFDKNKVNNIDITKKMIKEIIVELQNYGWKCDLSFGETGLFIYKNKRPYNCFPDGFEV